MKTNSSFTLLLTALAGFATTASAQIVVPNTGSTVTITFDSTVANVLQLSGGDTNPPQGVLESDRVTAGWFNGMVADAFAFGRQNQDLFGFGNGAAGRFVDANNNASLNDAISSYSSQGLQKSGTLGMASNFLYLNNAAWVNTNAYLRIQNNTGATVSDWTIGFEIYGANNDTSVSTLNFGYAADNSLVPGGLTYTSFGSQAVTNTGSSTALSLVSTVNQTFSASVAAGDFLVISLAQTFSGGGGSHVAIDNFSVTAVPEPSTYAALAGLLALGLVMVRRRRRA